MGVRKFVIAVALAVIAVPVLAQGATKPDPLDPAQCDTKDSAMAVSMAFLDAWIVAKQGGRMTDADTEALMALVQKWDAHYNETGDQSLICREQIQARKTYRF